MTLLPPDAADASCKTIDRALFFLGAAADDRRTAVDIDSTLGLYSVGLACDIAAAAVDSYVVVSNNAGFAGVDVYISVVDDNVVVRGDAMSL